MTSLAKSKHDQQVDSLAEKYANEGYVVEKEPASSSIPFDLDGYQPDLVAKKDGSGLIIEVKSNSSGMSLDRMRSVAEEIAQHPGWRFLLVTLQDIDALNVPTTMDDLPKWSELSDKIRQVELLVDNGALEPAILYLWSVLEAAMRRRAIAQNIPVERLQPGTLLNQMYSQGEVSVDQIDEFRDLMNMRNRIAHGGNLHVDPERARQLVAEAKEILFEWTST